MTEFSYIKNGETLSIRAEACTGCGACIEVCPHGVLELREAKATIRDRTPMHGMRGLRSQLPDGCDQRIGRRRLRRRHNPRQARRRAAQLRLRLRKFLLRLLTRRSK